MPRTIKRLTRLKHERELWRSGVRMIAGVDEVGRGPLAGPVVAAAVIFEPEWIEDAAANHLYELNDSKQLDAEQREEFFQVLTSSTSVRFGIGIIDVTVIDSINILQATYRAMHAALEQLQPPPQHVLVDGRPVKTMRHPQTAIIQGDGKSYSIAAASVIAKVTRDRMMAEFDARFPGYGFAAHKGYSTPQHLEALGRLGICEIHRRSFSPCRPPEPDLFDFAAMPSGE